MDEMKSLNGIKFVDEKAREDIEAIKKSGTGGSGDATEQIENYLRKNSQDIAALTINLGGTIYTYNGSTAVTITIEDADDKVY